MLFFLLLQRKRGVQLHGKRGCKPIYRVNSFGHFPVLLQYISILCMRGRLLNLINFTSGSRSWREMFLFWREPLIPALGRKPREYSRNKVWIAALLRRVQWRLGEVNMLLQSLSNFHRSHCDFGCKKHGPLSPGTAGSYSVHGISITGSRMQCIGFEIDEIHQKIRGWAAERYILYFTLLYKAINQSINRVKRQ